MGNAGRTFYLRELLGEGGQGWVFKANYDDPDGFWIVVKLLRPEGLNQETLERFERETRALQMLGAQATPNPNIVRFYDHGIHHLKLYGADLLLPFIALEFVNGPNLASVVDALHGQGMQTGRVVRIMRQVARALTTVHESQIVHRDLKPSNILLEDQNGREVAKITDFGLVKAPALSSKATATIAGATLGYAPPEQYELGNSRVTPKTDVFSFGAILFELLSGRVAFPHVQGDSPLRTVARMLTGERPSLAKHALTLSPELRASPQSVAALDVELVRATSADPDARHESIGALWNALEPILRFASGEDAAPRALSSPQQARISAAYIPPSPSGRRAPSMRVAPFPRDRFRGGAYLPEADLMFALGMNGIYSAGRGSWQPLTLSRPLDVRGVRGLAQRGNDSVLLFGQEGLLATVDWRGNVAFARLSDSDCNWYGAFTEDGDCVLAGERRSKPIGVLAEVGGSIHVHNVLGSSRFSAVTRLSSGALLGCGNHGDLMQVLPTMQREVPWGRTGHLASVVRNNFGGAYAVGTGGHALSISMTTSLDRDTAGELTATLESVHTTKDLCVAKLDRAGNAWAIGQNARLLERRAGVWQRVPMEGLNENFVAIDVSPSGLLVLSEDGTLVDVPI